MFDFVVNLGECFRNVSIRRQSSVDSHSHVSFSDIDVNVNYIENYKINFSLIIKDNEIFNYFSDGKVIPKKCKNCDILTVLRTLDHSLIMHKNKKNYKISVYDLRDHGMIYFCKRVIMINPK